jgi:hypothetical protein
MHKASRGRVQSSEFRIETETACGVFQGCGLRAVRMLYGLIHTGAREPMFKVARNGGTEL